jgi:HEPN domain-containing protein
MINVEKQIEYWVNSAKDDLETAIILIEKEKFAHGLFFCHLVIEKMLKACYVNELQDFAPRSHNLIYLSELANIEFSEEQSIFMGVLMKYQLKGRYPDFFPDIPDTDTVKSYLELTKQLKEWINKKLLTS